MTPEEFMTAVDGLCSHAELHLIYSKDSARAVTVRVIYTMNGEDQLRGDEFVISRGDLHQRFANPLPDVYQLFYQRIHAVASRRKHD